MRKTFTTLALVIMLGAAACAPADLDITPSPVPTNTPEPTVTRSAEATPAPTEAAAESAAANVAQLVTDQMPSPIPAGQIQWQRETQDCQPLLQQPAGSQAVKSCYTERGGGLAEVTIAIFDTEENAQAYYDNRAGDRRLENSSEEADLPTPNAFGGGTYGSLGLIKDGTTVLVVSIPRFSSTVRGNPTIPLAQQFLAVLESVRAGG